MKLRQVDATRFDGRSVMVGRKTRNTQLAAPRSVLKLGRYACHLLLYQAHHSHGKRGGGEGVTAAEMFPV